MNKKVVALFAISVFAGAGYVAWAYSPFGKTVISKRLLSRWEKDLKVDKANKELLEKELKVLDYEQHVLLWNLTRWHLAKPSETTLSTKEATKRKRSLKVVLEDLLKINTTEKRKEKKLKNLALQLNESGIEKHAALKQITDMLQS